MRRYIEIYSIILRNSLIRELSFKANFLLWMLVEILWFCGQIVFFSIIFGNVSHIGDWSKWEVVLLVGTHQIISQLFQAFFFLDLANIPELAVHREKEEGIELTGTEQVRNICDRHKKYSPEELRNDLI